MKAIGLRVRSGFAIAVVIEGSVQSWRVQHACKVPLCVQGIPYARFPYHPLVELGGSKGEAESRRAVAAVRSAARLEIAALLAAIGSVDAGGIVGGSPVDPASIANAHIRAHAREGQLFRDVVASELRRAGIESELLSDRDVLSRLAAKLRCPQERLRKSLAQSGRGTFRPWGADEKLAASGALWHLPEIN